MVLIVIYDNNSQLVVEGFGIETIIGAVRDVVSGNYPGTPNGAKAIKIEIANSLKEDTPFGATNFEPDASKPLLADTRSLSDKLADQVK